MEGEGIQPSEALRTSSLADMRVSQNSVGAICWSPEDGFILCWVYSGVPGTFIHGNLHISLELNTYVFLEAVLGFGGLVM